MPAPLAGVGVIQRGFALGEAVMLILAIGVALAILITAGARARPAAGLNRDLGNLRRIGQWVFAYSADFEGLSPALDRPSARGTGLQPSSGRELAEASNHAVEIMRQLTGREDLPYQRWFPHLLYNYLPLASHVNLRLPDRTFVATGDVHRMNWTDDPVNKHDRGLWQPYQEPQGGQPGSPIPAPLRRFAYSSSFQMPIAWYDRGQSDWTSGVDRIRTGGSHRAFLVPAGVSLGPVPMSGVTFPSQKVMLHDYGDWYHSRGSQYFAVRQARVAMAMADGSVGTRDTRSANPGWNPAIPSTVGLFRWSYAPRAWEPGSQNEPIVVTGGAYRWTRGGLRGRDFGGDEINTGQR